MVLIKQRRLQTLTLVCFVVLIATLFIGGHQSNSGNLFPAPLDKLAHFIFYGTLTIIASIAFPKFKLPLLGLVIIAIGCADEIHQFYVPSRHPGLDDLACDIMGCLLAMLLVVWLRRKFESQLSLR